MRRQRPQAKDAGRTPGRRGRQAHQKAVRHAEDGRQPVAAAPRPQRQQPGHVARRHEQAVGRLGRAEAPQTEWRSHPATPAGFSACRTTSAILSSAPGVGGPPVRDAGP